ncbi:hypothetical protein [Oricola sp.]|uniref:hypothetical protein n=1 Tax=Oricola sp. TaxID=1979950 RepID=UPI0025E04112|nr:hypothetical protein [Oricola sp.]MCI5077093.1 hypothetical protein [Oricola sp.]
MKQFPKAFVAMTVAAMTVGAATAPAFAKVYTVVFAGKPTDVDCPESPEGHNMSWVSRNCTAVRVAPGGLVPHARAGKTALR